MNPILLDMCAKPWLWWAAAFDFSPAQEPRMHDIPVKADKPITPPDIADCRYFTAWEGAQLAYWGDSDTANPKPVSGQPDPHGPLGQLTFCVLVLASGETVTGQAIGSRELARQDAER